MQPFIFSLGAIASSLATFPVVPFAFPNLIPSLSFSPNHPQILSDHVLAVQRGVRPKGRSAKSTGRVVYSPPIVITQGGTYSGNWESLNSQVPAVSIRTREPVIIQNCNIRSRGHLITARFSNTDAQTEIDLTVKNCYGYALSSGVSGKPPGMFALAVYPKRIVIENNYVEQSRGIVLIGDNMPRNVNEISIQRNRFANLDGRTSDGNPCNLSIVDIPFKTANGMCGSGIQINGFLAIPNIKIAWNEVINQPYNSHVEDVFNVYNSSGLAASPIRVHNNYIQGASYPADPTKDLTTGSGINAGDSSKDVDASNTVAFVHAYDNQVVSTANVGIFIAAGHDNQLYRNRVISRGYLPDGKRIFNHYTGMYIVDVYGQKQNNPSPFYNNRAFNNRISYAWVTPTGLQVRDDTTFPDCAESGLGQSLCTGNIALPNLTLAMEQAEYRRWLNRVQAASIQIGPGG